MQISIFNVQYKCTKDMFAWQKAKWTLCVYWAQLWRAMILGFGLMVLFGVAMFNSDFPKILNSTNNNADLALYYWYQNVDASWIWMWGVLLSSVILGGLYLIYYTLTRKNYKSFDREALISGVPYSFWSWNFWKRFLLLVLTDGILGVVQHLIMDDAVGFFINSVLGIVLMHIYLHGGTWGFLPISKRRISQEKTSK